MEEVTYEIEPNLDEIEPDLEELESAEEVKTLLEEDPLEGLDKVESTKQKDLDIVKMYLKEIGSIPLLTVDEEVALAKRISEGDESAKEELALANLRLVVNAAKRYNYSNVHILDLIQEGNIGLLKATGKYKLGYETRFSTYAMWWIRQAMNAFIYRDKNIRIPENVELDRKKYRSFYYTFEKTHGVAPSEEKIMQELDITETQIQKIKSLDNLQTESLNNTSHLKNKVVELSEKIPVEEKAYLDLETLVDEKMVQFLFKEKLTKYEYYILYSTTFAKPVKSLADLGREFFVSRQRMKEKETEAFEKVKGFLEKEEASLKVKESFIKKYDLSEIKNTNLVPRSYVECLTLYYAKKEILTKEEYYIFYELNFKEKKMEVEVLADRLGISSKDLLWLNKDIMKRVLLEATKKNLLRVKNELLTQRIYSNEIMSLDFKPILTPLEYEEMKEFFNSYFSSMVPKEKQLKR